MPQCTQSPASFHDLGWPVLGYYRVNVVHQLLLGGLSNPMTEKPYLHATPVQSIDQQHLIRIPPHQPIKKCMYSRSNTATAF